ncbi:MAG: hypothetical protein ACI9Y7_002251 [Dokdonia sp.]|jgi:hypothetical protein
MQSLNTKGFRRITVNNDTYLLIFHQKKTPISLKKRHKNASKVQLLRLP